MTGTRVISKMRKQTEIRSDALVAWCEHDGVPFVPWEDFDDVRSRLEAALPLPGAVAPERCPGWRLP